MRFQNTGRKNGYLDYGTLAKAFNKVLNNGIMNVGEWECIHGEEDAEEIFQFFIVDYTGAQILQQWTDELLFYSEALDMYVWGVTHFGTNWDYVLTDVKCTKKEG